MVVIHGRKFSRAVKCSPSVMLIKTHGMLLVGVSATFLQDSIISLLRASAASELPSHVWNYKRCLCSLKGITNLTALEPLADVFCSAEFFSTKWKPLQEGNCVGRKLLRDLRETRTRWERRLLLARFLSAVALKPLFFWNWCKLAKFPELSGRRCNVAFWLDYSKWQKNILTSEKSNYQNFRSPVIYVKAV